MLSITRVWRSLIVGAAGVVGSTPAAPVSNPTEAHGVPSPLAAEILSYPYEVVDSTPRLRQVVEIMSTAPHIAVDIEACVTADASRSNKQLGQISLIQLCSQVEPIVYLVDAYTLGADPVARELSALMADTKVQKFFFDCRRDVEALGMQMRISPRAVLDLQLFYAGLQWTLRSTARRSGMAYVLKHVARVQRKETDAAVQLAMTKGQRAVWDVRPLPPHFLEYAASDVRHTLLLGAILKDMHPGLVEPARQMTAEYVAHYNRLNTSTSAARSDVSGGSGEVDPSATEVRRDWLEKFFGPGGVCGYCRQRGHTESECFQKAGVGSGTSARCKHCGEPGHLESQCFKKYPQRLKCEFCGMMGHSADRCFRKHPCKHCGGSHAAESCYGLTAKSIPVGNGT